MFNIGDKVFYPMHGAGIIEAIEEKEFTGEKQLYYIMKIPTQNMNVMIPKGKEEDLRLRKIVDSDKFDEIRTVFSDAETEENVHPNQRHRLYMDKIKSGDILEEAKVIRDLTRISKTKNLGTADKNMLTNAQQVLISELVMVKGIDENKAHEYLDQVINQ
ncbi:CarD family transcriptional regulator [Salinibacillus xinjiangensis]|uniref:CarD family transcriptional regulator n=1 Tax=Salinibacillus xinjiangensis TaxID=1229268 RepID=A0A6G1X606_9BACI|nr:CarD family transcriptional regulator [Salinibacillus xinjiangensis]MRG86336.1 CarD family transcriptional regulator [Salinibacillus xinjiangensis]